MAVKICETVPDKNTVLLVEIEVLGHRDRPGSVLIHLSTILRIFQTVEKYVYSVHVKISLST
jgi:hypothetical protein